MLHAVPLQYGPAFSLTDAQAIVGVCDGELVIATAEGSTDEDAIDTLADLLETLDGTMLDDRVQELLQERGGTYGELYLLALKELLSGD